MDEKLTIQRWIDGQSTKKRKKAGQAGGETKGSWFERQWKEGVGGAVGDG